MNIYRIILEKTAAILVILVSFLMAFLFWDKIKANNGAYSGLEATTLLEQITVSITLASLFCIMFFGGVSLLMKKTLGWILTLCSLIFLGTFNGVSFFVELISNDWFRFDDNWTLLLIPIVFFTLVFLMLHKEFWKKYPSSRKHHLILGVLLSIIVTIAAQFF